MNINEIKIRIMTDKDIDFVVHANKEVHEASNQTNEIIEFKHRLKEEVLADNPKAYVIVVEYNNELIGMALYSTVYFADEGQMMWLSNIFVEKEYRNKKIAKAIMNYLKQICIEKGYHGICGAVDHLNEKSINFCNSINGKWLDTFKMVYFE